MYGNEGDLTRRESFKIMGAGMIGLPDVLEGLASTGDAVFSNSDISDEARGRHQRFGLGRQLFPRGHR